MNDKAKWESFGEDGTQQLIDVTGRHSGIASHLCKYLQNILLLSILVVSLIAVTKLGQVDTSKSAQIPVIKTAAEFALIPIDTDLSADILEKTYKSAMVTCSNNNTCSVLKPEFNCVCIRGDRCCCPTNWICCNTPGRCCCRNH